MRVHATQLKSARVAGAANARRYGLARQHQEQHRALRRRYLTERRLSAVTRIAFFVSAGAFLAWASPFLPRGMDPSAYAGPAALAAALGSMAVLFWLISTTLSFRATGRRRVMAPWASLFDDETGIYNRAYLVETLDAELVRAQDAQSSVAVFVMQIGRQTARGDTQRLTDEDTDVVIGCLNRMLGWDDTLATLQPDEFAAMVLSDGDGVTSATLSAGLRDELARSRRHVAYRLRIGQAVSQPQHDARAMLDEARADLRASRATFVGSE